jgi:hypothetical protein
VTIETAPTFLRRFDKLEDHGEGGAIRALDECIEHRLGVIVGSPDLAKSKVCAKDPLQRHAIAGPFCEGVAIGGDRLLQPRGASLTLAEPPERKSEIVLGRGPVERCALAGSFCEGVAIGGDSLLQPRGPALALPKGRRRSRRSSRSAPGWRDAVSA